MDRRDPATRTRLYDHVQLDEVIADMTRRAAGLFPGSEPIGVIGILRRGAPLAGRIAELLVSRHGMPPPLRLDLRVSRYADDLTLLHPETLLVENPADADLLAGLAGRRLLVVDDVLSACPYGPTSSASACRWRRPTSSNATSRPTSGTSRLNSSGPEFMPGRAP